MVEQLGLCIFTAEGLASVCGRRTKILQASQQGKKKKKPKQERKERQRQSKGLETHQGWQAQRAGGGITRLDHSGVHGEWRRLWPERQAGWGPQGPKSSRGGFQGSRRGVM